MTDYITIDLNEYEVDYTELVDWAKLSGIELWAISSIGYSQIKRLYAVKSMEDLTAFKLRFGSKQPPEKYKLPDFFDNGNSGYNYF